MVAEIGDLTRFESPRELMKCLGLIPSEYTSAERRRQGVMTKAGHTHARRALVEGAWAYRYPAKVSRHLPLRFETQPTIIQDIRWKAQVRPGRIHVGDCQAGPGNPLRPRQLTTARRTQKDCQRALDETQPRCGVTLGSVKRLAEDTRA